jgi:Carboxypeptidase regulatory-like domain
MNLKLAGVVVSLFTVAAFAQEFRGTISGAVTDPTGASIPGAKVTVTEEHTGTKIPTVSDSAGQYAATFLLPGDYDIVVQSAGFKEAVRKGVHVGAGDHPVIDVKLSVGEINQSVEVSADASMVNTENATVGQAITSKEVEELPINGRTPLMAAALSIGVIGYAQPTLVHPFDSGGAAGWTIAGAYTQTSELLINGSPDATWDGRLAFSPPQDAVQEVRVKAFDTDAAFGHTAGGTLNQITKSGTNTLHGSGWEFNQPNTLTANDFFLNKAGTVRPVTHFNQYGVTAGGPFYIPHVIDTRNKMFWFFAWEGIKDGQPNPSTASSCCTVPTDAMRAGNFAGLPTIYDPFSATLTGTTVNRSPLPNNAIPGNEINSISKALLQFYPEPNVPGGAVINNYISAPNTTDNYSNEMGRVDYNMSDRSRLFADVRHTEYTQAKNNWFSNIAEGSLLYRNNWGMAVDEVYTLNPTNILDVRLNFTRMNEGHDIPSIGFNPTTLGFPSYLSASSNYLQLPVISMSGTTQLTSLGATGANKLPSQSFQLFGSWMKIKGNHTIKAGADVRQYRLNTFTAGNSTGAMSFSANSWVRASSSASSTVTTGQDLATMLMGLPTGGSYDLNTFASWWSYYAAGFIQDDWRVKRNLTINLGLRFEHDFSYNEKYGRTVDGFDTTSTNPLSAAATAAYAKNPIAQLPASQFSVLGGLTYPGNGNTAVYDNHSHVLSPRVGMAWTPEAMHGKTVVRGGFGIFVAPVTIASMGVDGKYSTNPLTNQQGFSQTTSLTATSNNFLTPLATSSISNPFPNGFLPPTGNSLGLLTFAGQAVAFINPNVKSPYSMRWNIGVQHTITPNLMLEVDYIGNHSIHLPIDFTQLNGLPRSVLSTLATRDPNQSYLTTTATNPFSGLQTTQNTASTTPAQLLARFPEFPVGDNGSGWNGGGGVLEQNLNVGSSYFHSFDARLEKRVSHGLNFVFNYVYAKLMERMTWLNASDPLPEKRVSAQDRNQRFVLAATYQLPIGKGQPLNIQSRVLNSLVGGWLLNTVYTYQTGAPIMFVNGSSSSPGDYVYFGGPLNVDSRAVGVPAFNTAVFDTKSTDTFNYHLRTFSTMFSNARADGINQFDPSISKRFAFTESASLQIRMEAYNVLNHPVFAAPNTTASNAAFGTITATANRFRTIQLGARIVF